MKATTLANWESRLRPLITRLPPKMVVSRYSKGRLDFLKKLKEEIPTEFFVPPENLARELWGIKFRTPIMNAAGMFKNGECYEMVAKQGAGAYLGGTGTWNSRRGNMQKEGPGRGIYLPFVPYPRSHSASNWLGLPNDGDITNSGRAFGIERVDGCPVVWSVMGSPDFEGEEKLGKLVEGMEFYEAVGVDVLEINESCPNTAHGSPQDDDLVNRSKYIKEYFLDERSRKLPVIVKFSSDTEVEQLPALLDVLFEFGYDGVIFGNASTDYARRREMIDPSERKLFDFYIQTFGGSVSGRPLRESSLELASRAVEYLRAGPPSQEFHVIRTGGIETLEDIQESERAGISLNQWYTGYFENFAKHGHDVYRELFNMLSSRNYSILNHQNL